MIASPRWSILLTLPARHCPLRYALLERKCKPLIGRLFANYPYTWVASLDRHVGNTICTLSLCLTASWASSQHYRPLTRLDSSFGVISGSQPIRLDIHISYS